MLVLLLKRQLRITKNVLRIALPKALLTEPMNGTAMRHLVNKEHPAHLKNKF
jgi:hypothetical protein